MTINSLVNTRANQFPDKVAIRHGKVGVTYTQLNKTSSQLVRYFATLGITEDDVVALAGDRSPELVIFLLAFAKAGITYLPVDNNLPIDRIGYMLSDAAVKLLITSRSHAVKYAAHQNILFIEDALTDAKKFDDSDIEITPDPAGVAYILYTSGSTGRPKGVLVKRSGLLNLLLSIQQSPGITARDTMLFTTTISFDIAELEIFLPLVTGATVVVADAETVKDGRALVDMARYEQVTIMQGTPFMWRTMLEAGWEDKLPVKVFCGGEAMTRELAQALVQRSEEVWNMYGPTETTVYSIIKKVGAADKVITVGKPVLNTQIYILDEALNQVAHGETGEIYIGGEGVAQGYLNRPELTEERFIADTFSGVDGQNIYKTGDLGQLLPDGDVLCLGRVDHQIKIRGYRIEAEEVETQLKRHNDINNALVVPYTDEAENIHLVAYVVAGSAIAEAEMPKYIKDWNEHLAKSLPDYMVPDIFMPISAIPVMPNGKTDRAALPKPVIFKEVHGQYVAPETETEICLSKIFLRNIAIAGIGIHDNFFHMGVDSLIMVKVMVQIEKEFGKRYPLSILIRYPTLMQLAGLIDSNGAGSEYRSLIPIRPRGNKVPLYIVHGIGLNLLNMYHMVAMLNDEQPVYGLQAVGLDGTMEPMQTIEEIAAFYNSEILMHDPVGPYAISGYSFGGYIAFEMVKQLRAAGKEVKMLALFDTNLQIPTYQMPLGQKLWVKGIRQFKKICFRAKTIVTCPLKSLDYMLLQLKANYDGLMNALGINVKRNTDGVPQYMQDIMATMKKAFEAYVFKPQDVKINIFKAAVKMYFVDDSRYFGWRPYAKKGVEIHIVPGDHKEMFMAPNDRYLAKALQEQLDQIN